MPNLRPYVVDAVPASSVVQQHVDGLPFTDSGPMPYAACTSRVWVCLLMRLPVRSNEE